MTAEEQICRWLMQYKKKTVTLDQLQQVLQHESYETFRQIVLGLLSQGCLTAVKSGGADYSGLPRRLRIVRGRLFRSAGPVQADAVRAALLPQLDLSYYYEQPLAVWQADLPYIACLSHWLAAGSKQLAPVQQRSWDIFHDEKYLSCSGAGLLHRLGLTKDDLQIEEQPEPLLLAVNPERLAGGVCHHLAVENKAPYYRLLPLLPASGFASLILGYGWKIAGNLSLLPVQTGRPSAQHVVWYFGDFDWEGLRIWQQIARDSSTLTVRLAVPFYLAFLDVPCARGKENQQADPAVLADFLAQIDETHGDVFERVLAGHQYWPQEALTAVQLKAAWKELAHETGTFC